MKSGVLLGIELSRSKQILDACCGGRHWWWEKEHPLAVYMDNRELVAGSLEDRPNFEVSPDVLADFREMSFADDLFQVVLFDPPHITRNNADGVIAAKYGVLHPIRAREDLRRGFRECWRVLAPGGTLIFKWSGLRSLIKDIFPVPPLVGTRSRRGETSWFVFYKPLPVSPMANSRCQTARALASPDRAAAEVPTPTPRRQNTPPGTRR